MSSSTNNLYYRFDDFTRTALKQCAVGNPISDEERAVLLHLGLITSDKKLTLTGRIIIACEVPQAAPIWSHLPEHLQSALLDFREGIATHDGELERLQLVEAIPQLGGKITYQLSDVGLRLVTEKHNADWMTLFLNQAITKVVYAGSPNPFVLYAGSTVLGSVGYFDAFEQPNSLFEWILEHISTWTQTTDHDGSLVYVPRITSLVEGRAQALVDAKNKEQAVAIFLQAGHALNYAEAVVMLMETGDFVSKAVVDENDRLRKALTWYAKSENYLQQSQDRKWSFADVDSGERARKALGSE